MTGIGTANNNVPAGICGIYSYQCQCQLDEERVVGNGEKFLPRIKLAIKNAKSLSANFLFETKKVVNFSRSASSPPCVTSREDC